MYRVDKNDENAIVFSGHEEGIADSELRGISDMRNMNIVPIPGEASVNFATSLTTPTPTSGSVVSADAGADTILISGTAIAQGQAVIFNGGSLPSGIVAGTVYWITPAGGGNYTLSTNMSGAPVVNITSTGTGTYASVDLATPKYFTFDGTKYWLIDSSGYVWSNLVGLWQYTGNKNNSGSNGNGLVAYTGKANTVGAASTTYVFAFGDSSIDYATISAGPTVTWNYQWTPGTNYIAPGARNNVPTQVLKTAIGTPNSHEAMVATDNRTYYCDANFIGRFYQKAPDVAFNPETASTYTTDNTAVLPATDTANCLTQLGTNVLVGGQKNVIYPWDRFSPTNSYPILISEYNIKKLVTVNTNTFIFVGNRGRIYLTNGSQAQLYKKLPDHLSGTIEPYYVWGGATSNKNQLYFSAQVYTNANVATNTMGGVWAIDLDTKAIRMTNQLSYGTYAGYASALIPNFSSTAAGTGFFAGWNSGASTYGIDTTVIDPYTGSQAYIDYDLIPIGTFYRPNTPKSVEYKLSAPMVSGESVSIYYRKLFSDSYTLIFTSTNSTNGGGISEAHSADFENAQWVQLRAVTNSTASSPSYTRLTEVRIRPTS